MVVKSDPVFAKEGIPRFLTSFLIELEDRVNEMFADKAFKKSASPTNAKSLNAMKQGVKKWLLSNESQAERVKAFRENPKLAEEEDIKPTAKPVAGAKKAPTGASGAAADDESDSEDDKAQKVRSSYPHHHLQGFLRFFLSPITNPFLSHNAQKRMTNSFCNY